jgi:hypothetical protein
MNSIRRIARAVAAALWFLSGGTLGATIVFISVLWSLDGLPSDGPLNAGDAMGAAASVGASLFCAPLGFIAGLFCAGYLWQRRPLFPGKPGP